MKKVISIGVAVVLQIDNFGQTPAIEWQQCYGGSWDETAYATVESIHSGYVAAGWTNSNNGMVSGNHGLMDFWVVKLSVTGALEWQKCFGGSNSEMAFDIVQTADGGYAVVGNTYSNDGDVSGNKGFRDVWVVKLDDVGILQWQKCLGGSNDDTGFSIRQTWDGGYIVAGYTSSYDGDVSGNHGQRDFWVIKLDDMGNLIWQKCLGGSNNDQAKSIIQTSDSGYVVTGYTTSYDGDVNGNNGYIDAWVVKLDAAGNLQWQKCLGGTADDYASAIIQTPDGGFAVAAHTYSNDGNVSGNHGSADVWALKLTATGSLQWQMCFGGSSHDIGNDIAFAPDSGFVLSGVTQSGDGDVYGNHGYQDMWVIKITSSGTLQWQKCLGGSGNDNASSILYTFDEGYLVTGLTASNDGDVSGNHGFTDFWIVKLHVPVGVNAPDPRLEATNIYPNPAHDELIIENTSCEIGLVELYNVFGQLLLGFCPEKTSSYYRLNISSLPTGIYQLKVWIAGRAIAQKIIVL